MGNSKRAKKDRRFSGKGPRPDLTELKRKEAAERQAEYDKLSIQTKLDRLPPSPQAERQRAKLLAQLEGKKPIKQAPTPEEIAK